MGKKSYVFLEALAVILPGAFLAIIAFLLSTVLMKVFGGKSIAFVSGILMPIFFSVGLTFRRVKHLIKSLSFDQDEIFYRDFQMMNLFNRESMEILEFSVAIGLVGTVGSLIFAIGEIGFPKAFLATLFIGFFSLVFLNLVTVDLAEDLYVKKDSERGPIFPKRLSLEDPKEQKLLSERKDQG